jgi:hypothetical protein
MAATSAADIVRMSRSTPHNRRRESSWRTTLTASFVVLTSISTMSAPLSRADRIAATVFSRWAIGSPRWAIASGRPFCPARGSPPGIRSLDFQSRRSAAGRTSAEGLDCRSSP